MGEGFGGCHGAGGGLDSGLAALAMEPQHGGAESLGDQGGPSKDARGARAGGLAALCCVVQEEERAVFTAALSNAADPCDPLSTLG